VSPSATPYGWASSWGLIAHGFGIIDGLTVTSTREAFETGYARGYRIFEVDLSLTKDSRIVGRHDWSAARFARYGQRAPAGGIPTLAEFSASLVKGRYHPVDADAIVDLMRRYPDAWVMTDLKIYSVSGRIRALKQLLSAAGGDQSIASRLIVQIYEEADVAPTRALGIKNLLYTFYRLTTPVSRALDFAKREGIKVITIPVAQASRSRVQDIKAHGLVCAAHTVNDPDQAASLRKRGVTLLYSDTLQP
jgi:glycerophosphoryl diester phosphodiesterase